MKIIFDKNIWRSSANIWKETKWLMYCYTVSFSIKKIMMHIETLTKIKKYSTIQHYTFLFAESGPKGENVMCSRLQWETVQAKKGPRWPLTNKGPRRSRRGLEGQEGASKAKKGPQRSRRGLEGQEGATFFTFLASWHPRPWKPRKALEGQEWAAGTFLAFLASQHPRPRTLKAKKGPRRPRTGCKHLGILGISASKAKNGPPRPRMGLQGQEWASEAKNRPPRPRKGLQGQEMASKAKKGLWGQKGPLRPRRASEVNSGLWRPTAGLQGQQWASKAIPNISSISQIISLGPLQWISEFALLSGNICF